MLAVMIAVAVLGTGPRPPQELYQYLAIPDASYRYQIQQEAAPRRTRIEMTSQTWHGVTWKHTILVQQPSNPKFPGTGILFITGDGPRPGDINNLGLMAEATGMPVAMLFDVPNQPIEGRKEDDLIAHTFEEYLKTGDATWPALFPMTKSAIRAMDTVVSSTAGSSNPIKRFVVTGASKRGWTTWFTGAAKDPRVIGIAPMVIDNLNLPAQMKHQMDSWGAYSEQIQDYTRRGIQQQLTSEKGSKLAAMVDPYSYRSNIKVPTLIVKGANDPYWTVDALDQYYAELKQPKWVVTVPNAGHGLEGGLIQVVSSIGAFARSIAGEFKMPKIDFRFVPSTSGDSSVAVGTRTSGLGFSEMKVWAAEASNLDFRPAKYRVVGTLKSTDTKGFNAGTVNVTLSQTANTAMFIETRYRVGGQEFTLSSPTKVFKAMP